MWIEIEIYCEMLSLVKVTPFAGVWIEISHCHFSETECKVTPFAGVWIEMQDDLQFGACEARSLPLRECGLK